MLRRNAAETEWARLCLNYSKVMRQVARTKRPPPPFLLLHRNIEQYYSKRWQANNPTHPPWRGINKVWGAGVGTVVTMSTNSNPDPDPLSASFIWHHYH